MFEILKPAAKFLRQELEVCVLVSKDDRTPKMARVMLGAAIGYALLPLDLIPDWIPVIGYMDDLIIVPALVYIALRRIPTEVVRECRESVHKRHSSPQRKAGCTAGM